MQTVATVVGPVSDTFVPLMETGGPKPAYYSLQEEKNKLVLGLGHTVTLGQL